MAAKSCCFEGNLNNDNLEGNKENLEKEIKKERSGKQAPDVVTKNLSDKKLLFFSERLKQMRMKSGLSQVEFAKAVNVSPSTIGMYEQGRRKPDLPTLLSICLVLGTTPNDILEQDKKFKKGPIEIDEILFEFIAGIKENNTLLCGGAPLDKETREKFALSITTALEVAKSIIMNINTKSQIF